VYLATPERISRMRLLTVGRELGVNVEGITTISYNKCLSLKPELFIVMGNEILPSVPAIGKRNIFHCQFPFSMGPGHENNIGFLQDYEQIIVNSEFTKRHVLKALKIHNLGDKEVNILTPPISLPQGNTVKDFS